METNSDNVGTMGTKKSVRGYWWKGSESAFPKCVTSACGLLWAEDNQGPKGSRRVFHLQL